MGFRWMRLGWTGFGWTGFGWTGFGWTGLGHRGFGHRGFGPAGLRRAGRQDHRLRFRLRVDHLADQNDRWGGRVLILKAPFLPVPPSTHILRVHRAEPPLAIRIAVGPPASTTRIDKTGQ
jgi:hypothetical protein